MPAPDVYRPDERHDFFLTVGGAAAVLTGLVFVAMSINLNDVTRDSTHRYRAIGTLTGFISVFVICSLALMGGQGHVALGVEWVTVATIAFGVYIYGYVRRYGRVRATLACVCLGWRAERACTSQRSRERPR